MNSFSCDALGLFNYLHLQIYLFVKVGCAEQVSSGSFVTEIDVNTGGCYNGWINPFINGDNYDLNKDAHGEYIYFCYKKGYTTTISYRFQ